MVPKQPGPGFICGLPENFECPQLTKDFPYFQVKMTMRNLKSDSESKLESDSPLFFQVSNKMAPGWVGGKEGTKSGEIRVSRLVVKTTRMRKTNLTMCR